MKTIMKFTAIVAFMLTTTVGMAKEPKLNLIVNNETRSLVFVLETQSEETKIKFLDNQNNILYSENVSDEVYSKRFDLKKLENGIYFFTMENALKSITYTLRVEDEVSSIIESNEVLKPFFRKSAHMIYLNLLNLQKDEVEIKVYDGNLGLVFEQDLTSETIIEKAFNFKSAKADDYTVVVKNSNGTYYENIVVN
ncbi:MAG: hypothetical protein KJP26_10320 [Maribacter sp.]|nr:hypothetical protein [Maribacter sp.]